MTYARLAAVLILFASPAARAADPWETPFTAEPAAIARAAALTPKAPDGGATILLEEVRVEYDRAGRAKRTYREVYRVETPSAVERWSEWVAAWSPWFQDRPTLRARVITADGQAHELSPSTIEERSVGGHGRELYADGKLLRAPLPAVAAGAVVEAETVTVEHAPLFDAGTVRRFFLGTTVPTRRARLVIDVPTTLPLAHKLVGIAGKKPTRQERDGRVVWTFDWSALEAMPSPEPGTTEPWPHLAFTTARSWADVAKRYGQLVDDAIAGSDVAALAQEARGDAVGSEAIAARVLGWLHDQVRYTGVELGEASIVPRSPTETLQRKFGDCKDQATLLVALLRASGVPAYVALLRTAPDNDVEPSLPGMDFDHAIVVAPGKTDLWIDPTSTHSRPGQLPWTDRGRLALVARSGTSGLTQTPAAQAKQNLVVEQRTFFLAESGNARASEDTTVGGDIEVEYRNRYGDGEPKQVRGDLESYALRAYKTQHLDELRIGDARALDRPFTLHLGVASSARGETDPGHAEVGIFPASLFAELPESLRKKPEKATPRRTPYRLYRPIRAEQHVRIVPPPGFAADELPAAERIEVGPWHVDLGYAKSPDGEVRADLVFETDKTVLSPQEWEAARDKIVELDGRDGILVRLPSVAESHFTAGRLREGVAELRRLAALHPTEALHQVRLSDGLLKVGLGTEAREAARQATVLEPKSGLAWTALGLALSHDLLGRLHAVGWDSAGAEAAFRKAIALDPKAFNPRFDLGVVLEYDPDGRRYGQKARLADAVATYRAVRQELKVTGADMNLLVLLARMGAADEVLALAKEMEPSVARDGLVTAAVAAARGIDAAAREAAGRASGDHQRAQILREAAATLIHLRDYPEAIAMARRAREAGDNSITATEFETLGKVKRREQVTLREDDPASVVRNFLAAIFVAPSVTGLFPYFVDGAGRQDADQAWFLFQRVRDNLPVPAQTLADLMVSTAPLKVDGDAGAWRVSSNTVTGQAELYVVKTAKGPRIAGSDPPELGELALAALERHDEASARRWLRWAKESGKAVPPLVTALDERSGHSDLAALEAAAAVLASTGEHATKALAALSRCAASPVEPRAGDCWKAQIVVETNHGDAAQALAKLEPALDRAFADWIQGHVLRVGLLGKLGRRADAARTLAELRKRWPDDQRVARAAALLAGDCAERRRLLKQAIDDGKIDAQGLNEYAWCGVSPGPATDEDLTVARRAVDESKGMQYGALNTLALVAAERGQLDLARDILRQSMPPGSPVRPADWLVIGRLDEAYGFADAARRAYAHIDKPREPLDWDLWTLAQRRLAAMKLLSAPSR